MFAHDIERIEARYGRILEIGQSFSASMQMDDGTERMVNLVPIVIERQGSAVFNSLTRELQ